MKVTLAAASLRNLRDQPAWMLLAAHRAPLIIALLQSAFTDTDKQLPGSALVERLAREIEQLRGIGEDLGQGASGAVQEWLASGWLERRLPAGASEDIYEPSVEAVAAMRYVLGALKPRTVTTESRLALVIAEVEKLALATDHDPERRLSALRAQRDRIDAEIESVRANGVTPMAPDRALERAREIIALADELVADFRSVRGEFEHINRDLRRSLVESEGSRGEVLNAVFSGVDLVAESDPGRTFTAFWRLMQDLELQEGLRENLHAVARRVFAKSLEPVEQRFLLHLTAQLMREASSVHDVMHMFGASLRNFVQSREFLEHRRFNELMHNALKSAIALRDQVRPRGFEFPVVLSTGDMNSVSRWTLHDPAQHTFDDTMLTAEPGDMDMREVAALLKSSEIDLRGLRGNIAAILAERNQASIAELLERFPAEQGLGTVIGYLQLGAKFGEQTIAHERVEWVGKDGVRRSSTLPAIYFLRERCHEFIR